MGRGARKTSYLRVQFLHIKAHRTRHTEAPRSAILAVAVSMVTDAHHMPCDGTEYSNFGIDRFYRQNRSNASAAS